MPGHLQDEEGVARGLPLKFRHQRALAFRESPANRGFHQRGDCLGFESANKDATAVGVMGQRGQGGWDLAPLQVNVAIHGHREKWCGALRLHQVQEQQE
jgi:hypothetical protein